MLASPDGRIFLYNREPAVIKSAVLAVVCASVLQILHAVDTCAQGDLHGYMLGALYSGPGLLFVTWTLPSIWRRLNRREPRPRPRISGLALLAAACAVLAAINWPIWSEVWFGGGHACGAGFAAQASQDPWVNTAIAAVYGGWPAVLAIAFFLTLIAALQSRVRIP